MPAFEMDIVCCYIASWIDVRPTVLSATGVSDDEQERPGVALQSLLDSGDGERAVLSEYHDGGSPTGMFMLRYRQWKLNVYPGYRDELFDLSSDPGELNDLHDDAAHQTILQDLHARLSAITDPDTANQLAFEDQRRLIAELGGAEAILESDEFDFTPVGS